MGQVQVQRTTTVTLIGQFTVDELRSALDGLPGNGRIASIKTYDGGQRDPSTTVFTVQGVGA